MSTPESPINQDEYHDGPWMLNTPDPVTLVLVGASPSMMTGPEELAKTMADAIGADIDLHTPDTLPPDIEWLATIGVDGLPASLVCWPEADCTEGFGLPDEIAEKPGLVVQSLLHPADPLTCLTNLLRILVLIDSKAVGILDINTGRWLERDMLVREMMTSEIEPREDLLWIVTSVSEDDNHVLQTNGLMRCGRHELGVETSEGDLVETAADLLASTAALCLETPLPETGSVIEIGPGLHLRVSGTPDDPEEVAMLEDAEHGESPESVLRRLAEDTAAVYRTERSTARHRMLAIQTWDRFLSVFDDLASRDAECYVEVPWEDTSGEEVRREHVWMAVHSHRDGAVLATPAHQGDLVAGVPQEPSTVTIDEVCSWRVLLDGDVWGPEQIHLLLAHLKCEPT